MARMKEWLVFMCLFVWNSDGLDFHFEDLVKSNDHTLIPGSRGHSSSRHPLQVNVSLLINTLNVDDARQVIKITGELQSEWIDVHLRFNRVNSDFSIGLQGRLGNRIKDHIWLPDLIVLNSLHPLPHASRDFLRVEHDGHLIWTQEFFYEFPCKFNLQVYPMGKQHCLLQIHSSGYDNHQVRPQWADSEAVHFRDAIVSPRYRIREVETTHTTDTMLQRTKYQLRAKISLESIMSWPVKQTVLPFVASVVTAYLSFFISISGLPARVILTCTSFIVACMFHVATYSKAPQAPLTTVSLQFEETGSSALEVFTGTCLTFIWIAIAETIIVHGLSRLESKSLLIESHSSLPGEHREILDRSSPSRGEVAAVWMDRCFRVLYPGIFLAFNAVYWIIYSA